MKSILFAVTMGLSFAGLAALPPGDPDFWNTSAYVEPQVSSAVSTESSSYDGFVRDVAVRVCDFFSTLPTGLMLLFR